MGCGGKQAFTVIVASNGNLYVDNTHEGVADFFIPRQGVTTIDEAAFVIA